jgi:hypothetical protein
MTNLGSDRASFDGSKYPVSIKATLQVYTSGSGTLVCTISTAESKLTIIRQLRLHYYSYHSQ